MAVATQQFRDGWLDLLKEITSQPENGWPAPSAMSLDHYETITYLPESKQIAGPGCKTFMFFSGSATCLDSFLRPGAEGGLSDYAATVERYVNDKSLRKGRDRTEILTGVSYKFADCAEIAI